MISLKTALITKILKDLDDVTELEIDIDGLIGKAINYDHMTGSVSVGDRVIVNTTAVDLKLGSGGLNFVLWNCERGEFDKTGAGHLMKLRYTPLQHAGLSVEEERSPHHKVLENASGIDGMPVIACGLHSQLLPAVITAKALRPKVKIAYIMSEGGALPAAFSGVARWLKTQGLLEAVISSGQTFGGDFEAVNIYSALAAAKLVVGADIAIVAMGPGIAGTGTALGHTGIEQGQTLNAAHSLGGRPVMVMRISQGDMRPRHHGVSHHCITALSLVSLASATIVLPQLTGDLSGIAATINDQIQQNRLADRHEICYIKNDTTLAELKKVRDNGGPGASTMGRGPDEEPAFFLAAGAAAIAALDLI